MRFRTVVGWSLVVAMVIAGASGVAVGQGDAGDPCTEVLANGTNGEPGEELAGAIGEQEFAIDSELADRRFEARLDNASSDEERARIIAAEFERLEAHVDRLEACGAVLENESGDGERERALAVRANATAERVNDTAAAAERLPDDLRREYGVDTAAFDSLLQRVLVLRESFGPADATALEGSDGSGESDGGDGSGEGDGGGSPWPFG